MSLLKLDSYITFATSACNELAPLIKLVKNGIIPLIEEGIIAILIVLLIIDLGKSVMAGKEDEIKKNQKLAIRRIVYVLVMFLVPWVVNVAVDLVTKNVSDSNIQYTYGQQSVSNAWSCWSNPDA